MLSQQPLSVYQRRYLGASMSRIEHVTVSVVLCIRLMCMYRVAVAVVGG